MMADAWNAEFAATYDESKTIEIKGTQDYRVLHPAILGGIVPALNAYRHGVR